jgi:hypothetical protein
MEIPPPQYPSFPFIPHIPKQAPREIGLSLLLKFQGKEEVANRISLEASLNRGFPSDSENARLSEPPFCHNVLLFMRVV